MLQILENAALDQRGRDRRIDAPKELRRVVQAVPALSTTHDIAALRLQHPVGVAPSRHHSVRKRDGQSDSDHGIVQQHVEVKIAADPPAG